MELNEPRLVSDLFIIIFEFIPLYYLINTCSYVCKRWFKIITNKNDEYWIVRSRREWNISSVRIYNPFKTAYKTIKQTVRAAQLLTISLADDSDLAHIITKGFPIRTMSRSVNIMVNRLVNEHSGIYPVTNRTGHRISHYEKLKTIDDKKVSLILGQFLGPFNEKEIIQTSNNKILWICYVRKLLRTIDFPLDEYLSSSYSKDEPQYLKLKFGKDEITNKLSDFVTRLGLYLKEVYNISFFLSNRLILSHDNEKEREYRRLLRSSKETPQKKLKRKINSDNNQVFKRKLPEIQNVIYTAHLGYNILLLKEYMCYLPWKCGLSNKINGINKINFRLRECNVILFQRVVISFSQV
jgi:hypothetical protein